MIPDSKFREKVEMAFLELVPRRGPGEPSAYSHPERSISPRLLGVAQQAAHVALFFL